MLKTDKINGKRYRIKNKWNEISLLEAEQIENIELPQNFIELYTKEDKSEIVVTEHDFNVVFTDIYCGVLSVLSDIPEDIINKLEPNSLYELYNRYLVYFHVGLINLNPCGFSRVKSFWVGLERYVLPIEKKVQENIIPLGYTNALQFCDSLDLIRQGVKSLRMILSVYVSKEKDILKNYVKFGKVKMNVVWSLIDQFNNTCEFIGKNYKWVFDSESVDGNIRNAFRRSGLEQFGTNAWLYEVAQGNICGQYEDIKKMDLYEFIWILSYLRCTNKFEKYASK